MEIPRPATYLQRGVVALANLVADLPGARPPWVIVDLGGSYPAREEPRRIFAFPPEVGPRDPSLERLAVQVEALAAASWCEGVVLRFGPTGFGPAAGYALRRLIGELRAAGKDTIAYLAYPSLLAYWVASAADEVISPEAAAPGPWGLGAEALYYGDAFDKLGATFDRVRIREYKTALETFARGSMSDPQREQITELLEDVEATIVADVAKTRGRDETQVRGWLDRPPSSAPRAVETGLIDRVAYAEDVIPDDAVRVREAARYLKRRLPAMAGRVGVVSLRGMIVPGESRRSPVDLPVIGGTFAGSETLVRALRTAAHDASTKAVVLHVDSGGGSALASDLIWREVVLLDQRKPVVAVMGDAAASGGYYVATHARRIVAAPTTVTGSIGVFAGKFVLAGLLDRLGVRVERVELHRFANLFSSTESFDEEERAYVEDVIRSTYEQFTQRVADGRGLSRERVDEIGRGRVWSGRKAVELGLVDELGDVRSAIERAKELAGLPAAAPVWNVRPPRQMATPPTSEDVMAFVSRLSAERVWMLPSAAVGIRG